VFQWRGGGGGGGGSSAEAPDPTKLVIGLASSTQDVAIPFELVDLTVTVTRASRSDEVPRVFAEGRSPPVIQARRPRRTHGRGRVKIMAVVEMQKEPRSIKSVLFVIALLIGFLALGSAIYWLIKPSTPRQIKLSTSRRKRRRPTTTRRPPRYPSSRRSRRRRTPGRR
jgi:hypothetical protein